MANTMKELFNEALKNEVYTSFSEKYETLHNNLRDAFEGTEIKVGKVYTDSNYDADYILKHGEYAFDVELPRNKLYRIKVSAYDYKDLRVVTDNDYTYEEFFALIAREYNKYLSEK